jgi:hypothetical protein
MLEHIQRLAWDPTAPVPAGWPHGWWGVLLLFCVPLGAGIPSGVLLGHADRLGAPFIIFLYVVSDVVLAAFFEPVLRGLAFASRRVPALARTRAALTHVLEAMLPAGSVAGPTAIVFTGFGLGLPFGRALAAVVGYGLVSGWLLSIAGDSTYFLLGMVSTLWLLDVFGDPRAAVLAALVLMLVVPLLLRRLRRPA